MIVGPEPFERKAEYNERNSSGMRCMWTATRGTTLAQPLQSMRKAATGSIRFCARGQVFDKGVVKATRARSMALSRGITRRARREHREPGRRIHAAAARDSIRCANWHERTLY